MQRHGLDVNGGKAPAIRPREVVVVVRLGEDHVAIAVVIDIDGGDRVPARELRLDVVRAELDLAGRRRRARVRHDNEQAGGKECGCESLDHHREILAEARCSSASPLRRKIVQSSIGAAPSFL